MAMSPYHRAMATKTEAPKSTLPAGERVRYVREQILGISQSELGSRVGCSKQTIANVEAGRFMPSLKLAANLERETGVPAVDFVPPAVSPSPSPASEAVNR
jgi:DNA-binding XRE family transcriptional regulator